MGPGDQKLLKRTSESLHQKLSVGAKTYLYCPYKTDCLFGRFRRVPAGISASSVEFLRSFSYTERNRSFPLVPQLILTAPPFLGVFAALADVAKGGEGAKSALREIFFTIPAA